MANFKSPMQGKYVILFFYPLDFTFVCPTEITAFSDRHGEFEKINTEVRHPTKCELCSRGITKRWTAAVWEGFCAHRLRASCPCERGVKILALAVCQATQLKEACAMQILGVSVDSQFSHLAWCQTGAHVVFLGLHLHTPFQYLSDDKQSCKKKMSNAHVGLWHAFIAPHANFTLEGLLTLRQPRNTPAHGGAADRNQGGVGDLKYPLVSDLKREITTRYNVLTPDGVALRGLFIIDKEVRASPVHRPSITTVQQPTGMGRDG